MRSGGQNVRDPHSGGCWPMLKRKLFASSFALTIVALCALAAHGQSAVRDYRRTHERQILDEFTPLIDHVRRRGFYVIDRDPTDDERKRHALIAKAIVRSGGYNAERTRMDLPISVAIVTVVQQTSAQPIVRLPTVGGSLPLSIITDRLRTVTITVPIANYDNNQHAENENIRLQNLWDGIETMAAVMTMKPKF
jgi:acetylornithine deacetylase/succinyl-diaminopimelate desuccinylase-like protein